MPNIFALDSTQSRNIMANKCRLLSKFICIEGLSGIVRVLTFVSRVRPKDLQYSILLYIVSRSSLKLSYHINPILRFIMTTKATTPLGTSPEQCPISHSVHSIKELACLYYPALATYQASRRFRRLLYTDPLIFDQLTQSGFRRGLQLLSPLQMQIILSHLGTPEEFDAICRQYT